MTSTAHVSIGAVRETAERERRVAIDPEVTRRLTTTGTPVYIESGAGVAASYLDAAYQQAGAQMLPRDDMIAKSDVVAVVRPPDAVLTALLRSGQLLIGLVEPLNDLALIQDLAARGVTVAAFELLPRTLSRAESMDAVSSQASAAGYRAGIVAAASFGGTCR